jgi:hypothetical protein
VDAAVRAYRSAAGDQDLSGLLGLFGSTELVIPRWKRQGESVSGLEEKGSEVVRVPLREPVHIRPAFDKLYQISRVNCP